MTGVVLCGGKSMRMGTDKGLLEHQSLAWVELAANKLSSSKLPVVLSVNGLQFSSYSAKFYQFSIIKDNTAVEVYGPLKGILSVHLQFPEQDLFVLACDMAAMRTEVIAFLISTSQGKKEEAFVFLNETLAEPLCAIYTSRGLKKIYDRYKHEQLKKNSLQYVLENLDTNYSTIPNNWKTYFNNYNSPDDLVNFKL
ncbi:molybdenum cofactor guanylyltransferase [Segetibacter koreensis]|uniref:molybdenum cofactor guanylyltransferase n=1 Tax=Segetibacter koreensis TaxID=398037 RepID=UPI0003618FC1|nr:molybdenum cofactor guanylyltransferase [Segetibacter koreensis]